MQDQLETNESSKPSWLAHDLTIGALAGGGLGSIAGLFAAVRLTDNNVLTLIGAIVGVISGVILLTRSHRRHDRFLTPAVIVSWVVLVGSGLFIGALISAIANFE